MLLRGRISSWGRIPLTRHRHASSRAPISSLTSRSAITPTWGHQAQPHPAPFTRVFSSSPQRTPVITVDDSRTIRVAPSSQEAHTASFIVLHGLGDTGQGWADVSRQLFGIHPHIQFVIPTAPNMPVTLNQGMSMPAWYDLRGLPRSDEACEGIEASREAIEALVAQEEAKGIPASRIVVGGFSQGGALALYTGLQRGRGDGADRVGGIICMSGYLPKPDNVMDPSFVPVRMFHGEDDEMVGLGVGQETCKKLVALGVDCTITTYPDMGHSCNEQEVLDVSNALAALLPAQ